MVRKLPKQVALPLYLQQVKTESILSYPLTLKRCVKALSLALGQGQSLEAPLYLRHQCQQFQEPPTCWWHHLIFRGLSLWHQLLTLPLGFPLGSSTSVAFISPQHQENQKQVLIWGLWLATNTLASVWRPSSSPLVWSTCRQKLTWASFTHSAKPMLVKMLILHIFFYGDTIYRMAAQPSLSKLETLHHINHYCNILYLSE